MGERKKAGGRQKGTPNKATAAKAAEIAATGLTPLDYMLTVMRNEAEELPVRLDAAKSAAPYVHPRLATIAHTGADGGAIKTENSFRPELLTADERDAMRSILAQGTPEEEAPTARRGRP